MKADVTPSAIYYQFTFLNGQSIHPFISSKLMEHGGSVSCDQIIKCGFFHACVCP